MHTVAQCLQFYFFENIHNVIPYCTTYIHIAILDIFFMCGKGVGWESPLVTLSITTTILQNKEAILVTRMAGSVFEKACFPIVYCLENNKIGRGEVA